MRPSHRLAGLTLVLALCSAAAPLAAQTLTTLLPSLSFPDPVVTPATKGCEAEKPLICQPEG